MWDRMLAFLGYEEEEGEEADEQLLAAPATAPVGIAAARRHSPRPARAAESDRVEARTPVRSGGSVTRLMSAPPGLVVAAPKRFDEAQEVADHLKTGQPVILHLEGMERELAQRLINFLAGSVYALGGEMHRVGSVVLFVPAGVEVTLPIALRMAEREGR